MIEIKILDTVGVFIIKIELLRKYATEMESVLHKRPIRSHLIVEINIS